MRELLRVTMDEKQIKQACEDWARSRSRADGAAASVIILPPDEQNPMSADVIFTKKRERKAAQPKPQLAEGQR